MARPLADGSLVTLSYSISWTPLPATGDLPAGTGEHEDGAVVLDSSELRGQPLSFPVGSRRPPLPRLLHRFADRA